VRRDLLAAGKWLALPTAGLAGVALFAPGRLELALRVYALVLAAAIIVLALRALRHAYPPESALRVVPHEQRPPRQPPSLARTQDVVVLGIASSFDLHYRLVPRLRATATGLLASRRNVPLAADHERARGILGDGTWELVRPDRPAPEDRLTTGIAPTELSTVLDALEAV
jgi:hypothetical protein